MYEFSLDNQGEASDKKLIAGIEAIDFDPHLNDILLIKVIDREIHVTERQTGNDYILSSDALAHTLLGEIPLPQSVEGETYNLSKQFTLSPPRNKLAISNSDSLLYVYSCLT